MLYTIFIFTICQSPSGIVYINFYNFPAPNVTPRSQQLNFIHCWIPRAKKISWQEICTC